MGELAASLLGAKDVSSELHVLTSQLEKFVESTRTHRDSIREVERRTSEANDARRRDALEATEAERANMKRHTEAMARMRQHCDAEAASLEAEARFSLGSLTRRISV